MKKLPRYVLLLVVILAAAVDAAVDSPPKPCELFTRADAESLFATKVSDPVERVVAVPAGNSCRYSFSQKGGSFGITIRVSTSRQIQEEGIFQSVPDQMERQKKARRSSETASKTFLEIPGLGDDAFWNGTDLWMCKGDVLVIITVSSVMEGTFPGMEAAEKAKSEKNLAMSRQAAGTILSRLG